MKTAWLQIFFCLSFVGAAAQLQEKDFLKPFVAKDTGAYWLLTLKINSSSSTANLCDLNVARQVSPNGFIVKGKPPASANMFLDQIVPANLNWKLSPRLMQVLPLLQDGAIHKFYIVADSFGIFKKKLQAASSNIIFIGQRHQTLLIKTKTNFIKQVCLTDNAVQYIDIADEQAVEEASISGFDYTLNRINTLHHLFPLPGGKGIMVSVKENRPDTADIDFKGRYIRTNAVATTLSSHATAMATIIAGGGNSFYTARGVAPAATISSSSFDVLLPDSDAFYRQYNISVQNHSYGTGIENFYGADAAAYDNSVISNPGLVQVFSSGNAGDQVSNTGPYNGIVGFANLTGSFKMAKNIITVGSADSFAVVPLLSSKGPAYDGRIKPDLLAYGEDGSSGAAALVSGTALLLQHIYKMQHADSLPDAALVKAILLNSAKDAGPAGIDFTAGYGNLDALRAAEIMNNNKFFAGHVAEAQQSQFNIQLPSNAKDLKIMVCWTDPPAAANAFSALVNDLDLTVTNTGNQQQWLPWVLNSHPSKDSLMLPAVRKKDGLNTQEQVTIDNPAPGDYTVTINGSRIMSGDQKFFVVYQWDTTGVFRWTYPTADDNLLPGKHQLLRFNNASTDNAVLEYMIAGSNNWLPVKKNIDATSSFTPWQTPDTTAVAILRMTINGRQFLSDSFTISAPLQPVVGYNCASEALVYWSKVAAPAFQTFKLGNIYMEPFKSTADSFLIVDKMTPGTWFSVAPILAFNKQGIRSMAFDYTTQGVGCYLKSFTADLINSFGMLELSLGSLYQIQAVSIEKLGADGGYHLWKANSAPLALQYQFTDSLLARGANYYRARIDLKNGTIIYSEIQTIYSTGTINYIVFPNPVSKSQPITIVATQADIARIQLFTVYGQKIAEKRLANLTEELSTASLAKGIYFYIITENGKKVSAGKLVVD